MSTGLVSETVTKTGKKRGLGFAIGIIIIIALLLAGISYYQATRFNSHIKINNTKVGGLTADQAIDKLQTAVLTNKVYIGQQEILDEADTKMGFTDKDLPEIKKLLKSQWTFFPSLKEKDYWLKPKEADQTRYQTMKKRFEEKLLSMNKSLKAPIDAEIKLEQGKIVLTNSSSGEQFDVTSMLKEFEKYDYRNDFVLNPVYLQPITEDSAIIKNKEKLLQDLLLQTVDYKVQDKVHTLKASEVIKSATVSEDMKLIITETDIKNKIDEINKTQSTLNKNFKFKTHSGSVISVKGQGYGWAIDVEKEAEKVLKAFENGENSITVSDSDIYGKGWSNEGIGYGNTTNDGIGDTYAEVSIAEQRIWIYKNGKLVVTTNVVTGKHRTGEDTSPGVWYILYKRQDYTLTGQSVGGPEYAIKVNYWAPFTNSGQGFHDASWRTNWGSKAYLAEGSGGCVNTPPSIMKTVYDNLTTYDPVVIY